MCAGRVPVQVLPAERHGDEDEDAQDCRSPGKYQPRKRQVGSLLGSVKLYLRAPLLPGALHLALGHVAEHDRRDGRQSAAGDKKRGIY